MSTLTVFDASQEPARSESQSRALRIVQVVNGEHYAGAERVQDLLAGHLPGHQVATEFVCVKHRSFGERRVYQDVPLAEMPVRHPFPRRTAAQLADYIRAHGIDLLHAHTPRSLWLAHRAARLAEIPLVYTSHDVSLVEPVNSARAALRAYTISLLRTVDVVIAVSPAALAIAERLQLGNQRVLVPNGVPSRAFSRSEPHTPFTIGTVALIRPRKGIETLIDAVAILRAERLPVRLEIVGPFETAEYERVIRRHIDRCGLANHVSLPGFAQDINSHLDQYDAFAMPSVLPEGTPMVVLEAMAAGLPVVGSDIAGVSDLIRHRSDGLLCTPGSATDLATALRALMSDARQWIDMATNAHRRQQKLFSADTMAARTRRAYDLAVAPAQTNGS